MIVLRSTYDKLKDKYEDECERHENLKSKWNNLVTEINRKGGRLLLAEGHIFSKNEIKTMIALCHPDKHGEGSTDSAKEITIKLLRIRSESRQ